MAAEEDTTLSPEQLLEEGKKHLAAGNAPEAAENFQEACGMLAEQHGQLAYELAEPYYLYGKSLLELARSQSTVLGSGIPVPDEKDDSSEEEEEEASAESEEVPETNEAAAVNGNVSSNAAASNGDSTVTSTVNEDAPGSSTANEAEDESDLKLAWEILELARVICQKQSGEEYRLKLADVQLVLAEVSLESDQTEQAIADLNASLQIRELFLDAHDRRIAEVHFNLGLAHSLCKQPELAITHLNSAKDVLLKKKELLNKKLEQTDLPEEKRKNIQEEVSEIDSLLPDLGSKISDTKEMKKLMEERENQTEEVESGFPQTSSSEDKKPVTDISHLIRKRATVADSSADTQAKRARTQENITSESITSESITSESITAEQ